MEPFDTFVTFVTFDAFETFDTIVSCTFIGLCMLGLVALCFVRSYASWLPLLVMGT